MRREPSSAVQSGGGEVRVLVFAQTPPPMHGSSYATELLLRSRFSEVFAVRHIDTRYTTNIADLGTASVGKLVRFFSYLVRLLWACLWWRPDYVIVTPSFRQQVFVRDAVVMLAVLRLTRARLVVWANNGDLPALWDTSGPLMRALVRWSVGRADQVVSVGSCLKEPFERLAASRRVGVIYNGVPDMAGDRPARVSGERVRIIYVSNMIRAKGWAELVRATAGLDGRGRALEVVLCGAPGKDSPESEISAMIRQYGAKNRIIYVGQVDAVARERLLHESDIFCLPTYYPAEALPLAILEAMQAGLAVVSTARGAVPEAVIDGRGGRIVAERDVASLQSALQELIDDPGLRIEMGRYNRERFKTHFTAEAVAERWVALIRELEGNR